MITLRPYKKIKQLLEICEMKEQTIQNLKFTCQKKSRSILHLEHHRRRMKEKYAAKLREEGERREAAIHAVDIDISELLITLLEKAVTQPKVAYTTLRVLDEEGWNELRVVKKLIPCNLSSAFYYEDCIGVFEDKDGYELIHYYEIHRFSECDYTVVGDTYEKLSGYSDYKEHPDYPGYKEQVYKETALALIRMYPQESLKLLAKSELCFGC